MVIQGLADGMLIGDIGEVRIYDQAGDITTGEEVGVKILLAGVVVLEERYNTVGSEVVIRDLRRVLLDNWTHEEFRFQEYRMFISGLLTVNVTLPNRTGKNVSKMYTLLYCAVRGNGMLLTDRFLTRFLEKEVNPESIEVVPVTPSWGSICRIDTAYMKSGRVFFSQDEQQLKLESRQNGLVYVFLVTMREQLEKYDADSLIYVRVCMLNAARQETDRITFNLTEPLPLHRATYVYRNPFGVPEVISFLGRVTETFDPQNELAYTQEGYVKVSDDPVETCKVRTGALTAVKRESVKDLLRSFEVYELQSGRLGQRVTVIEQEAERTYPTNGITGYTLTLRRVGYGTDEFSREVYTPANVFDKSFDQSYE